ncbi:MAG: GNAT family N-acetyltransferase [Verrucomicrobiales bacterium]|nr:GNAT family N-acetyltransferase [Verrucomicrobiales bacterium]
MSIRLRTLSEGDLDFANQLREIAGWNQTLADWRRFISLAPDGCFIVEWNGQPAGTATTTSYGQDLAWIGMVLVHPDFRRRGLGQALLEHCIHHLREVKKIRCVKLDATPDGQPLYEKLGFTAEWSLQRWVGTGGGQTSTAPHDSLNATSAKLDQEIFAADRSDLLHSLARDGLACRVLDDGSYGLMRPGMNATYLGSSVATCAKSGTTIARELIDCAPPSPLFWDLPDANQAAIELAKSLDFEAKRDLLRMYLGDHNDAGAPARMFGLAEPGLG